MARHAESWKIDLHYEGGTVYRVRFTHAGTRYERSTGESDDGRARTTAAQIYADIVSGRRTGPVGVGADLRTAFAQFLVDYTLSTPRNAENAKSYIAAQFIPFFHGFDALTAVSFSDYQRARLQKVSRSTLRKELSTLRQFREWCIEHGVTGIDPVPSVPKRGHPGTRAKNARRRIATILPPAEIARILLAMPERSPRSGVFVRPFFQVLWETGLRPYATVIQLEAPLHYEKGSAELFIAREIDKAKYERRIPLTVGAREALDRVCPIHGRLFDMEHEKCMRDSLEAACKKAKIDRPFSIYDFRHSRISFLANSGAPLAGVARLVGHKHVSTTALYVQADNEAALAALEVADRRDAKRRVS